MSDRHFGPHNCKMHGYGHPYLQCTTCDHEFCGTYWRSCPRCHGASELNRFPQPTDDFDPCCPIVKC